MIASVFVRPPHRSAVFDVSQHRWEIYFRKSHRDPSVGLQSGSARWGALRNLGVGLCSSFHHRTEDSNQLGRKPRQGMLQGEEFHIHGRSAA